MSTRPVVGALLGVVFGAAVLLFMLSGGGPHVDIGTPRAGSTVNGLVEITGDASARSQITGVKVRIDQGDWFMANDTSGNGTWGTWAASWNTTTVEDGMHSITASAYVSDDSAQTTIQVQVSNPPWVRILAPLSLTKAAGIVNITGEAGESTANGTVALVQVAIDPTQSGTYWQNATPMDPDWGRWSFAWNTTNLGTGKHAVAARAFDGALYSVAWVNEYFVDNRPFVTIVRPIANDTAPETVYGAYLVHGTAGHVGGGNPVKVVQVQVDNGTWSDAVDTSPDQSWSLWAYQWNSTASPDGQQEVCARAWDGSEYSDPVCAGVIVNNKCGAPPTISIEEPTDGQTVKGVVLIHGMSSPGCCGVKLVQVSIDHGDWAAAMDTSPDATWTTWARPWDTKTRDDGCLDLSARAWNGAVFSKVVTVRACVDNVPDQPTVAFDSLTDSVTVEGLYLIHGFSGNTTGVQLVEVQVDAGAWQPATSTGRTHAWSTWAFEWNTTTVPNGKHAVCARALDGDLYSYPACVDVNVKNGVATTLAKTELLKSSLLSLGLPAWLNDIFLYALSAGYVPVAAVGSAVPSGVLWLRSRGYLRR